MIWRDKKIILIHIPRTGGTSIEKALSEPKSRAAVERGERIWNKHLDAYRAEKLWPEFHDPEYKILTVMRDPLELVVSQYILNRVRPTIKGFRMWMRRLGRDEPMYLTAAEVDEYERGYLPEGVRSSAGYSIGRFLATEKPVEYSFIRFSHLAADFRIYTGLDLGHLNRRAKPVSYLEWHDRETIKRVGMRDDIGGGLV